MKYLLTDDLLISPLESFDSYINALSAIESLLWDNEQYQIASESEKLNILNTANDNLEDSNRYTNMINQLDLSLYEWQKQANAAIKNYSNRLYDVNKNELKSLDGQLRNLISSAAKYHQAMKTKGIDDETYVKYESEYYGILQKLEYTKTQMQSLGKSIFITKDHFVKLNNGIKELQYAHKCLMETFNEYYPISEKIYSNSIFQDPDDLKKYLTKIYEFVNRIEFDGNLYNTLQISLQRSFDILQSMYGTQDDDSFKIVLPINSIEELQTEMKNCDNFCNFIHNFLKLLMRSSSKLDKSIKRKNILYYGDSASCLLENIVFLIGILKYYIKLFTYYLNFQSTIVQAASKNQVS